MAHRLVRLVLVFALVSPCVAASPGALPSRFQRLPAGWKVINHAETPRQQAAAVGQKLGGRVLALTNTLLDAEGRRLQVNLFQCASDDGAEAVRKAVAKAHGGAADCAIRNGKTVVEFVCDDLRLVKRAGYVLGFRPRVVTYRVSFEAAPIKKADYMAWNNMFNLLLAWRENPRDQKTLEQIAALRGKFDYGREISLRTHGLGATPSTYVFKPQAVQDEVAAGGDVRRFSFGKLPQTAGLPCVSVTATVTSEAFAFVPTRRKPGPELLSPTEYWPSKDPRIVELTAKITGDRKTDAQKVEAILAYLMPGRNIRFGGPITGSRYGVPKVLEQGFGQCWDFSDLCVTLCRAAGIPCRQVAGWLHGQCGHIWAEVMLDRKGWQQIDPTAGMACGSDYIPYLTSETGHMPILYLSMPEIKRLQAK